MNNKRIHKRILSAVLAITVLLCGMLLWSAAVGQADGASDDTLRTSANGAITFLQHEKTELSAYDFPDECQLQWQIALPEGGWADIVDADEDVLTISYALIANVMDENGVASVRCKATDGDAEYYTAAVQVQVILEEEAAAALYSMRTAAANSGVMALADGDDATTYVTITVNYLVDVVGDGNTIQLFDPYVANIGKGTALEIKELNPTYPGYKPTFGGADLGDYFEKTLTAAETTTNLEFDIIYERVPVKYYARYYLQNIANDLYTEAPAHYQEFEGYAGDTPSDAVIEKPISGFTSLFHEPDTIAADGSTVFECYYDRNYYLISFDLDGGYGTAPIYARYETSFIVAQPTRPGFVFQGWELVKVNGVDVGTADGVADTGTSFSGTVPAENRTYKAIWTTTETRFTVVNWLQNANPNPDGTYGYSYMCSEEITAYTNGTQVHSHDMVSATEYTALPDPNKVTNEDEKEALEALLDELGDHIEYNDVKTKAEEATRDDLDPDTKKVVVEGDGSTVVNVYFDRKEYTLKFYYAMSTGSGTDTMYYVIGGSTYAFGSSASGNRASDEITALDYYMGSYTSERGLVTALPTLNDRGIARKYGTGADNSTVNGTAYQYHYIYFTAKFGADISELWPCDVFNTAKRSKANTHGYWSGDVATVSAWNGEHHVEFTQNTTLNQGNQTVKGNYEKLDYALLWRKSYGYADKVNNDIDHDGNDDGTAGTVAFLCFWENGTDIYWSVPELYRYRTWLELPEGMNTDGLQTEVRNGTTYYLAVTHDTYDDSTISQQTIPGRAGYLSDVDNVIRNWSAIFISNASLSNGIYNGAGGGGYNSNTKLVWNASWNYTYGGDASDWQAQSLGNGTYVVYNSTIYNPNAADKGTVDHTKLREAYIYDLFYPARRYNLKFYNYNGYLQDGSGASVPYGTPLTKYGNYVSPTFMAQDENYPANLEPDAYKFVGWYTSPHFDEGTEMDWDTTMPDNDMTVYAKWVPITHDVKFYLSYSDMVDAQSGKTVTPHAIYEGEDAIDHGTIIPGTVAIPTHTDHRYSFVGWFYMKNGVETAFDPSEMTIQEDMMLYAKWKTSITTTYQVNYVTKNGEKIADSTEGHIFTGNTKTFTAKAEDALNLLEGADKDLLWLPQTRSHSILMVEPNADGTTPEDNKFDFVYVSRTSVKYTVQYLDVETLDPVHAPVTNEVNKAVVFELPIFVEGYVSSPISQTVVLSANEAENVITFYYTKHVTDDDEKGLNHYIVHHMVQTVDGSGFTEHDTSSGTAEVGTKITPTELTIPGFKYVTEITVGGTKYTSDTSGTITEDRVIELNLYYERQKYPYVVKHMLYGSGDTLIDESIVGAGNNKVSGTAYYKSEVSRDALTIPGYDVVGANSKSIEIAIDAIQTGTGEPQFNVIKFYYKPKQVEISYVPVGAQNGEDMSTWLTRLMERPASYAAAITGSAPIEPEGYEFVGWYSDAACTVSVPAAEGTVDAASNKLTPIITQQAALDKNYTFRFYAKFQPVQEDLKITKQATDDTTLDANDSFLFRITGTDVLGNAVDLTVSIQGADAVTVEGLYCGEYTVTELKDWSWTYDNTDGSERTVVISSKDSADNTATFTNAAKPVDWLHGEASKENQFNIN